MSDNIESTDNFEDIICSEPKRKKDWIEEAIGWRDRPKNGFCDYLECELECDGVFCPLAGM